VKADKINITETVESARKLLEADKKISPALRAMFEMLLMIITLLAGKLGLNSQNSSKPHRLIRIGRKKPGVTKVITNRVANLVV
jgi:hypothetical protein